MNVGDIKAKVRRIVGKSDTTQLSDADLLNYINNFYQDILPKEAILPELQNTLTFDTQIGVSQYTPPSTFFELDEWRQAYSNDDKLRIYENLEDFRALYPFSDSKQNQPVSLYYDPAAKEFILRPIADAVYTIRLPVLVSPTAFVLDTDVPMRRTWALWIAYGTALEIFRDDNDEDNIAKYSLSYGYFMDLALRRMGKNVTTIGRW